VNVIHAWIAEYIYSYRTIVNLLAVMWTESSLNLLMLIKRMIKVTFNVFLLLKSYSSIDSL